MPSGLAARIVFTTAAVAIYRVPAVFHVLIFTPIGLDLIVVLALNIILG